MTVQNWIYQTEILSDNFIPPLETFGFLYLIIRNDTGKAYIGRRNCEKNGWQKYFGSCKILNKDIEILGKENFTRIIIKFVNTTELLSKVEADFQTAHDVLTATFEDGTRKWYNGAIRYKGYKLYESAKGKPGTFKGKKHTKESLELMTEARKKHSGPNKGKTGTFTGKTHSNKTRKLQSESGKGKVKSLEHRAALSDAGKGKTAHNKGKARTDVEIQNMKEGMSKGRQQRELWLIYLTALQIHFGHITSTDIENLIRRENLTIKQKHNETQARNRKQKELFLIFLIALRIHLAQISRENIEKIIETISPKKKQPKIKIEKTTEEISDSKKRRQSTKANKTPEQKEESYQKLLVTLSKKTDKEIAETERKRQETITKRTPEQITSMKKKQRDAKINRSDEEKLKTKKQRLNTLSKRTPEENLIHNKKISDGKTKRTTEQKEESYRKLLNTLSKKTDKEIELSKQCRISSRNKNRLQKQPAITTEQF